jgi:deoxyadenosine/deoxycytidine kinase
VSKVTSGVIKKKMILVKGMNSSYEKDQRLCNSEDKAKIIALVGPVGVGKTTIRKYIVLKLREKGVKVTESYMRLNHLLAYFHLLLITKILRYRGFEPISTLGKHNPRLFIRLFPLWKRLMILSLIVKYLMHIYIPCRVLRRNIAVEDYLLVTVCDLIWVITWFKISLENILNELSIILKLLVKLPIKIIYLKASRENLVKRWIIRRSFERDKVYMSDDFSYIRFHESCIKTLLKSLHFDSNVTVVYTDNAQISEVIEFIIHSLVKD